MQHAVTAQLGEECAAKPHASSSPFPESSRRHSGNLMQERTQQGIGGGDGGDGSVLCTGDRER